MEQRQETKKIGLREAREQFLEIAREAREQGLDGPVVVTFHGEPNLEIRSVWGKPNARG